MHIFPSQYEQRDGIYFPRIDQHEIESFDYSDGDAFEGRIKEIIESTKDRSLFSLDLRRQIWDWRSSCHLSPVRANILRPLEHLCHGRVLELGSGCGIITRYLGELGGTVVALEASPFRASITKLRNHELSNVAVVCDRIEEFEAEEKFDLVTMIGVLQYARLFSNCGKSAELNFIENAARQLSTDGVLAIAIQNKIGLKSFSGYPEANVGLPYFGIENLYGDDTIVRFGLDELKKILSDTGLTHHAVLFPFPDYHMPSSILNESATKPSSPFRPEPLMAASAGRDRNRLDWTRPQFSLERAWESVHLAGSTAQLSNAFLIIAGKTEQSLSSHRKKNEYAWHFSVDRHPRFAIQKTFTAERKGILVSTALVQDRSDLDGPIKHTPTNEKYIAGRLWWEFLVDIVNRPGWTVHQIAEWIEPWLAALNPKHEHGSYDLDETLPGKLFDCTPSNCIQQSDGTFTFIDREWEINHPLAISYLVIRGVFGSLYAISSCAIPEPGTPRVIVALIKEALSEIGITLTKDHIDHYVVTEEYLQNWIAKGGDSQPTAEFHAHVESVSLDCRIPTAHQAQQILMNQQLEISVADLKTRVAILEENLQSAESSTKRLLQSRSWRITAPLRKSNRAMKRVIRWVVRARSRSLS